jgi:hypothetical protein
VGLTFVPKNCDVMLDWSTAVPDEFQKGLNVISELGIECKVNAGSVR